MGRILYDTFAGSPWSQLTDHVGEVGAIWRPHADYAGTIRISGTAGAVFSNPLDTDPALYYASAQLAGSLGLYLTCGLQGQGTGEVISSGTITLTGGASGSINTLTVNGVNILPYAVPFNTSLAITAQDVANAINNGTIGYSANNGGGTTTTIYAAPGFGSVPNGLVVNSTRTTITATHANMAGGVNGTTDNSIGVCYGVQLDDNSFYRVRHSVNTWLLEKVVNGVATTLASSATPSPGAQWTLVISVAGSVHTVSIALAPTYGYTAGAIIPATLTLSATDASIPIAGSYFGIWGSSGGTSAGVTPQQTASKAMWLYGFSSMPDLEAGTNEADLTLPQLTLAATVSVGTGAGAGPTPGVLAGDIILPQIQLNASIDHVAVFDARLPLLEADITGYVGHRATIAAELPLLEADISAGFPSAAITLPQVTLASTGFAGLGGGAAITLPQVGVDGTIVSTQLGTADIALPQVQLEGVGLVGNRGTGAATLPLVVLEGAGFAGFALVGSITLPQVELDAQGFGRYLATMDAKLQPLSAYMVGGPGTGAVVAIVAMNLRTGGITEYTGWTFTSLMKFKGRYFAGGANGLYELTGETDDGAAIASDWRTPNTDLSPIDDKGQLAPHAKRPTDAYLSYQADEPMLVTVYVDDDEYEYEVPKGRYLHNKDTAKVRPHKAALGKGIETHFIQFGVKNIEGGDFVFDSMRVLMDILKRRV